VANGWRETRHLCPKVTGSIPVHSFSNTRRKENKMLRWLLNLLFGKKDPRKNVVRVGGGNHPLDGSGYRGE
jgi:hypothetical protein